MAIAQNNVDNFSKRIQIITDILRKSDPIGVVSIFSVYATQTLVGQDGVDTEPVFKNFQQHHAELLMALVMTIPSSEWENSQITPIVMQTMFDNIPKIAETLLCQRTLAAESIVDRQNITIMSLQDRIRFNTQVVRNWGYYSEVIRISTDLYGPLDDRLKAHFGFGATDLIMVMTTVIKEFERRHSEYYMRLKNVIHSSNTQQMAQNCYKYFPEAGSKPEDLLAAMPPNISCKSMASIIKEYCDLKHPERASFSTVEIAKLSGKTENVVELVFKSLSLTLGSLAGINAADLLLSNPIWDFPGIDIGNLFVFPIPQMVFSHIHSIMARLAKEAGIKTHLESRRADYLEDQLEDTLKKALPEATAIRGAKWQVGTKRFETDLIMVLDRTVLIAEAKSNHLTPQGLRGAPNRVKRHVSEMILYPSQQSARLASTILSAKQGDIVADKIIRKIGIAPDSIDQIIRISVTLDDFSILSSAEAEFKEIGWIPADHQLAPTITIADLIYIADILDHPLTYIHYLNERMFLQKSFRLLGDELDFLGLYLSTGFDISEIQEKNPTLSVSGMSESLDRYYMSRDAGVVLQKPKLQLNHLFRSIIKQLQKNKPLGWTTIGLSLLSVASPNKQIIIKQYLTKLRKKALKKFDGYSFQIQPPIHYKTRIIFYAFPETLRGKTYKIIEKLAIDALKDKRIDNIVIFSRCAKRWGIVYEEVLLVNRFLGCINKKFIQKRCPYQR